MIPLMLRLSGALNILISAVERVRMKSFRGLRFAPLILPALVALGGTTVWAADVLPVPALTAHVIDQTGTLTPVQTAELEQKLAEFERSKGSQIVVLMVATTQPEEISGYANRVGNAWKIGRKSEGDGVLLIVAKNDRRVRIEVAKSLEGAIPDLAAKQIIDSAITPNFKAGNVAAGLIAASDRIMARIAAEGLPAGESHVGGGSNSPLGALEDLDWLSGAIFLLFAVPVGVSVASAFLGRKLGSVVAGAGVGGVAFFISASIALAVVAGVAALVWALLMGTSVSRGAQSRAQGSRGLGASNAGWGSGWGSSSGGGFGSSSGGGGFSSGGGGDFGGGGSSGDW